MLQTLLCAQSFCPHLAQLEGSKFLFWVGGCSGERSLSDLLSLRRQSG